MVATNDKFHRAATLIDDEFYTPRWFIEEEIKGYDFGDAPILCPCDGEHSQFVQVFRDRGHRVYYGAGDYFNFLNAHQHIGGAIVATNPPFSLFRAFIDQLVGDDRYALFGASGFRFLVVGPHTAISYLNIFRHARAGRLWFGCQVDTSVTYDRPVGVEKKAVASSFYTNLPKLAPSPLFKPSRGYTVADLKANGKWVVYDNRPDILFIGSKNDYPIDYFGLVAVPPSAGQIFRDPRFELMEPCHFNDDLINGKQKFARVVVRRRQDTGEFI